MKPTPMDLTLQAAFRKLLLASLALPLAACVSQERFDDTHLSAKHYQSRAIEQDKRMHELQDENRRLRAQLDASEKSLAEAGFSPEAIDERLANLKNLLAEIGQNPGDVTKFSVDGGYVYRMKDSIVFALGSADVSADGQRVLAQIAADIASKPHGKVYVRGHTDTTPISKPETKAKFPNGNLQLSAERAVSVGAFLSKEAKIDEARVVVMGFGPHDPIAPNDGPENKQRNRRVDIFVADAEPASADASR
jgi:flagellar motor protein MotB